MRFPIVFENKGEKLLGVAHRPEGDRQFPVVVFFHGFVGTKVEPHRLFVKMAERLVENNIAAVRFDFRGSGDSEGEFQNMTVEGEISDAITALDFASAQEWVNPNQIGVIGLSMGGAIAACVAGRDSRVKSCGLWAAVGDFPELFQEGIVASEQMPVIDYGGNLLGREFLQGMKNINPYQEIIQSNAETLIIHGDGDETVPVKHAHEYEKVLIAASKQPCKSIISDAGHTFNKYEWEQEVIETTAAWFTKNL